MKATLRNRAAASVGCSLHAPTIGLRANEYCGRRALDRPVSCEPGRQQLRRVGRNSPATVLEDRMNSIARPWYRRALDSRIARPLILIVVIFVLWDLTI